MMFQNIIEKEFDCLSLLLSFFLAVSVCQSNFVCLSDFVYMLHSLYVSLKKSQCLFGVILLLYLSVCVCLSDLQYKMHLYICIYVYLQINQPTLVFLKPMQCLHHLSGYSKSGIKQNSQITSGYMYPDLQVSRTRFRKKIRDSKC